jgi:hypothetical protein
MVGDDFVFKLKEIALCFLSETDSVTRFVKIISTEIYTKYRGKYRYYLLAYI